MSKEYDEFLTKDIMSSVLWQLQDKWVELAPPGGDYKLHNVRVYSHCIFNALLKAGYVISLEKDNKTIILKKEHGN